MTQQDNLLTQSSAHFTLNQLWRPSAHGPNISPFPLLQRRLVPWLSATQHAPKMVSTLGPSEDKVASKDKSSTMEARSTSHVSFICWHVIWFALYLSIVWNLYFALRDSIFWMEHGHQWWLSYIHVWNKVLCGYLAVACFLFDLNRDVAWYVYVHGYKNIWSCFMFWLVSWPSWLASWNESSQVFLLVPLTSRAELAR